MNPPRIGLFSCVHPYYDLPAVVDARQQAIAGLRERGCEVVAPAIPRTPLDAVAAAAEFRDADVDLVVLFFCTWVAEEITLTLAQELMDFPMLLWALPFLDRDIPMPSPMSGLVASSSNIRRMGKRFAWQVGRVNPENLQRTLRAAKVGSVVKELRRARFGVAGSPCPGMMDVEVDEADLSRSLGITTVHLELEDLLAGAASAEPATVDAAVERLSAWTGGEREIDRLRLTENLRLYVAIRDAVHEDRLDGYCIRCWPELRNQRKITPCAAHALMSEDGFPNSCEVDLTALITTYVLSRIANVPAFNFDITGYLEEEGAIQFAHCGAAAPSLAGGPESVALRSHMRTGTGATVEFPFQEGPVTLAKLLRPQNGALTLFGARGTAISSRGVRGSVATVRPEPSAAAFLDLVMREAVEHHIALVYGSWMDDLELFCEFTGIRFAPLAAASVGRTPWSAADAPVGLVG